MKNRRHQLARRILTLAMLFMAATNVPAAENGFDKRFEAQKRNALRELERRLTTRNGAGDEETWYVLAFHDQAAQAEFRRYSPTARSGYWNYDVKRSNTIKKVQGRKAAAEAVFQFLIQSSQSLHDLPPSAFDNLVRWQKAWDYRAFRSAKEAQAFYVNQ